MSKVSDTSILEQHDLLTNKELDQIKAGIEKAKKHEAKYSDMLVMYPTGLVALTERLYNQVIEYRNIVKILDAEGEFGLLDDDQP